MTKMAISCPVWWPVASQAHPVGAGGYQQRPGEGVQEIPEGELIRPHLRRARDDGGGEEHGHPAPSGIELLAPLDHLLAACLVPAGTFQQPAAPAAADGVAAEPASLTRDGATTITAARSSLPRLAATAAAPRAAVPMTGTPAHEAATARNSSRYCHHVLPRPAAIMRSRRPLPPAAAPGSPKTKDPPGPESAWAGPDGRLREVPTSALQSTRRRYVVRPKLAGWAGSTSSWR